MTSLFEFQETCRQAATWPHVKKDKPVADPNRPELVAENWGLKCATCGHRLGGHSGYLCMDKPGGVFKLASDEDLVREIKAKEDALLEQLLSQRGLKALPAAVVDEIDAEYQRRGQQALDEAQARLDALNTTPRGMLMVAPISGRLGTGDV